MEFEEKKLKIRRYIIIGIAVIGVLIFIISLIKIVNKEQEYYINLTDRSYSIQDIETKIGAKLSEEVQLQVIASINSDYVLTLKDGQAKGYYGQHIGQVINVEKLDEIDNIR